MSFLVVSMTTWKKRVDQAHLAIQSIFNQTRKPDAFDLNLDLENFPNGVEDLPWTIRQLMKEHPEIEVSFYPKDLGPWLKAIITWRKRRGQDYIHCTIDCDYSYPQNYLELGEKAMQGCDFLCTQHDVLTQGQHQFYSSRIPNGYVDELPDELLIQCPLDDHVIFHWLHRHDPVRGHKIDSVPLCRGTGYSFRRKWYTDVDPATLSQGNYPPEQFKKEREIMQKFWSGI